MKKAYGTILLKSAKKRKRVIEINPPAVQNIYKVESRVQNPEQNLEFRVWSRVQVPVQVLSFSVSYSFRSTVLSYTGFHRKE